MNPIISIVAINYNNAPWVIETLDSIAQQTYENTELIIVDDCSTDNSPELINKWLETYSKPHKFIRHEKNMGVCKTCNDGLAAVNGDYYSMIATDDVMMPEKLEQQIKILRDTDSETAAIFSDAYLFDDIGDPLFGTFIKHYRSDFLKIPSGYIFEELLRGNFIPAMSSLLKTEIVRKIGGYDEDLPFEDYDLWLRLSKKHKMIYSPYISVKYRMRKNSLEKKSDTWLIPRIKINMKHLDSKLVEDKLVNYALNSFQTGNKEALQLLSSIGNEKITFIRNLSKLKFPGRLGTSIYYRYYKNKK